MNMICKVKIEKVYFYERKFKYDNKFIMFNVVLFSIIMQKDVEY